MTPQQSKYKFINTLNIYSDDIEQPSSSTQPASTVDEVKYIVFKSSLLEFFTHCSLCDYTCTGEVAYEKRTFIAVKQYCSYCEDQITMGKPTAYYR